MLMVVVGAFSVLGPVVADEELGGPKAWGAILTAQAAGLVAGGLLGLRIRPRRMLVAATIGILAINLPLDRARIPARASRRSPPPPSSPGSETRYSG